MTKIAFGSMDIHSPSIQTSAIVGIQLSYCKPRVDSSLL